MRVFSTVLFGAAVLASQGIAHFHLVEPASWLQESPVGDPQKMGQANRGAR